MTEELVTQLEQLVANYTKSNEEKNFAGVLYAEIKIGQLIIANIDLVAEALHQLVQQDCCLNGTLSHFTSGKC